MGYQIKNSFFQEISIDFHADCRGGGVAKKNNFFLGGGQNILPGDICMEKIYHPMK